MFVKTVFFHQNMNKISFYKFFMVHYDYLIKIVIVYHANFMKLYSHNGKTKISQIFLGCIKMFFGGGGGEGEGEGGVGDGVGQITTSFTCG